MHFVFTTKETACRSSQRVLTSNDGTEQVVMTAVSMRAILIRDLHSKHSMCVCYGNITQRTPAFPWQRNSSSEPGQSKRPSQRCVRSMQSPLSQRNSLMLHSSLSTAVAQRLRVGTRRNLPFSVGVNSGQDTTANFSAAQVDLGPESCLCAGQWAPTDLFRDAAHDQCSVKQAISDVNSATCVCRQCPAHDVS